MKNKHVKEIAVGAVAPAILIAVWQAAAMLGWVNPQVLPSPLAVAEKWFAYLLPLQPHTEGSWLAWAFSGELVVDSLGSLYRVVVGFMVGAGLALPLGLAMGRVRASTPGSTRCCKCCGQFRQSPTSRCRCCGSDWGIRLRFS